MTVIAAQPGGTQREASGPDLSNLSLSEMSDKAGDAVRDMESMLKEAFDLLAKSIAAGDTAAITARNEAVTAMKGLVRLAEQNLLVLQQAAAQRNRQRVEHEYIKISIAATRVRDFHAQVKSASGVRLDLELTDVERTLTFDWTLPIVDDLSSYFLDPLVTGVPDPPVHASPFF